MRASGVSALDIRASLRPQLAYGKWAFRVKSWFGEHQGFLSIDVRVLLEPQIALKDKP